MTKADLIERVANAVGPSFTKRDVAIVLERAIEAVVKALSEGEEIHFRGFGSFKTSHRRRRLGRNPRTGEEIRIPAQLVPIFKPSRILKRLVAGR